MSSEFTDQQRRLVLQSAAGLVLAHSTSGAATAIASSNKSHGKPGDFDFLAGNWKIRHRRFKPDTKQWDNFEGEATCWTILAGVASIEELRIPARDFSGMGVRLLDIKNRIWHDYWVNGKSGVLTPPGQTGVFENGVGTFSADDLDNGKPLKVRGVWDRITPSSCRWYQSISRDDGKTWEENWFMDWQRA